MSAPAKFAFLSVHLSIYKSEIEERQPMEICGPKLTGQKIGKEAGKWEMVMSERTKGKEKKE